MSDLVKGMQSGDFTLRPQQELAGLGIIAGTTLSAILGVVEGYVTWRDVGMDAAELVLRALGLPAEDARTIATRDLPGLARV